MRAETEAPIIDFDTTILTEEKNLLNKSNITPLIGLAFSGGGIRSATVNLGVLQALASLKLLTFIDYLSTVSGGGYIGAFFSSLIYRHPQGLSGVEQELAESPSCKNAAQNNTTRGIQHLRAYSNYLTPKTGLFTTDTLAAYSQWLTNTLLNQIVLIFSLFFLFITLRIVSLGLPAFFEACEVPAKLTAGLGLTLACLSIYKGLRTAITNDINFPKSWLIWLSIGWLSVLLIAFSVACSPETVNTYLQRALNWQIKKEILQWLAIGIGAPFLGFLVSIFLMLLIGIMGRNLDISAREWWARIGGISLMAGMVWIAIFAAAIYLPPIIDYTLAQYNLTLWSAIWAIIVWIGTAIASGKKTGEGDKKQWRERIVTITPYVFILGLFIIIGYQTRDFLLWFIGIAEPTPTPKSLSQHFSLLTAGIDKLDLYINHAPQSLNFSLLDLANSNTWQSKELILNNAFNHWNSPSLLHYLVLIGILVLTVTLSLRLDVNLFSLHNFYRNRLTRCYLGATNAKRKPNPFTGFDANDDIKMSELAQQKPYHIINTALNISDGSELAWQQRKAASFMFAPLYSGYALSDGRAALRRTATYADNPYIGSLIAVSGAAASPNSGYHTNPVMGFIMTIFNARLGRWFGNPNKNTWKKTSPSPKNLNYLAQELFTKTNLEADYLYLSDGGHFENLGIYELVRRECKLIIAIDAGADANYTFEDLGNAIRKCQTDFGVRIDIPIEDLFPSKPSDYGDFKHANKHFAIGEVFYPNGQLGYLLYIKNCLTGDEPTDLINFKLQEPAFPHHSTIDQFFDESQFESYRHLGQHATQVTFDAIFKAQTPVENETQFITQISEYLKTSRQ
jgi:Patatin-like phospholipase